MRQLLPPTTSGVDPTSAYATDARPAPAGRPWVIVNMIATVDGATAVGGLSGPMGGPADKVVFAAIRAAADMVLVAAGTARAEGYGPARARPDGSPGPRIAVVTRSGALDTGLRLFEAGDPLVVTCEACPPERRAALAQVAEVIVTGDRDVDLAAAVAALAERGAGIVVCEGGPTLNGQMIALGLVDEWCLTVSPLLAGGLSTRAAVGETTPEVPERMRLDRLLESDGMLFARYVRAAPP